MTLAGRTAYFAGGTGAMGHDAVIEMAKAGMNVILGTHNPGPAAALIEECKDFPGKVIATGAGDKSMDELEAEFGSIDVYINKTGGLDAPVAFEDLTEADLNMKLQHQIVGAFNSIQNILPYLKRSKCPRIILSVTGGALNGAPCENLADSIARGGVVTMTKALGEEFRKYGITVNAVAMSGMIPDHTPKPGDPHGAKLLLMKLEQVPAGRLGTSAELAALICYIASEESGFVTGKIYDLTGGIA